MPANPPSHPEASRFRRSILWASVMALLSVTTGTVCAFFLWSLDAVTRVRFAHPWLIYLLPVAGVAVCLLYDRYGRNAEGGNNLLMDRIHEPGAGVPRRMAPLILVGTLITHLFGGSAGREGTAVQMGGSIAAAFCRWFRCEPGMVRVILTCGIAAGFSAVFGTPLAGTVFAIEVLTTGKLEYRSLMPCLLCALAADQVCRAWGAGHSHYHVTWLESVDLPRQAAMLPKILLIAAAAGLAARLFAVGSHCLTRFLKTRLPGPVWRPLAGGLAVIGLMVLSGTDDYLGLGVLAGHPGAVTLPSFFVSTEIHSWDWLWKLVFTVVTLSSGFKGGEVTPLFFIGAGLGNAIAGLTGGPADLFAAVGFVAIFAGATNTPLACTLMGIELFGAHFGVPGALACFTAYLSSGPQGIYSSQRPGGVKTRWFKRTSSPQ